ncbi:hypothetical protein GCM10010954_08050 [Halobacillus andaensis]|uniref:DUF3397 domain-containing protein n=1 Tax=Halobacillus andaensis TaxID=1176239 RepID=A0A917ETL9_HALAA|nr:DUF3397 domain-containing protein [Halobacillus andaensis]MBP2003595.1 Ca2+/Na+ antiporter [Halobacillus andaensis]GGF11816.1 hypothetical protein GCM10010954_08050 [Halobacillus andaensis]
MSDVLVSVIAFVLTAPFLFLFVLYFCTRKWYRNKKKAVHQTAQLMVPVLVAAVHTLLIVLFGQGFFAWILVFLLCLLGLALIVQYKVSEEIRFFKAFKGFLRLTFLLFMFVYMGLATYGIVDRVFL